MNRKNQVMKNFIFIVLSLLLIPSGICGIIALCGGVNLDNNPKAFLMGCAFPVIVILMLYLYFSTKCPKCKKSFVAKKIGDEDLGVSSNAYRKKVNDSYHTYEKHRHLLTYRCTSCGHEWQKTVEVERRLD